MKCPFCHNPQNSVVDSRPGAHGSCRRRRLCGNCGQRFTTFEELAWDERPKKPTLDEYVAVAIDDALLTMAEAKPDDMAEATLSLAQTAIDAQKDYWTKYGGANGRNT